METRLWLKVASDRLEKQIKLEISGLLLKASGLSTTPQRLLITHSYLKVHTSGFKLGPDSREK